MVRCWWCLPDRILPGMAEYRIDTDVGNRALQHCGATRMGYQGFSENSKNASEVAFCYGKLREAELRRNVWTFACRRTMLRSIDSNTMLLNTALWSPTTTYFVGSIVADQYANLWISRIPNNLANDPLLTVYWEPYFGPLSVALYDSTTTYFVGELVYTTTGNGLARVYLSLQNNNEDVPGTATAYDATTVYRKNQVVTYLSVAYMSLIDLNSGNTPSLAPALWNAGTTYGAAASVGGSDGVIYTSIAGGNLGNDPTTTSGFWTSTGVFNPWTTVFVGGSGSDKWLLIGGTEFPNGVGLTSLNITYPLGVGPTNWAVSRNIFKLPAGFLREASQHPKAGVTQWLGAPTGITYNDWVLENGFLLTNDVGPIAYRFVANVTDVSRMEAMFCEGLAARIAMEVCEPLTQSTSKLGTIAKVYDEWMSTARTVNAIEQGTEQPPDDDYVTVRL
jgi:hypothetical protein